MLYHVESEVYASYVSSRGAGAEEKTSKKLNNAGAKREALEWR